MERFQLPDVDVKFDARLLDDEQAQTELRMRNRSTRLKVLGVLLEWVSCYWHDFELDAGLQTKLSELLRMVYNAGFTEFVVECEDARRQQQEQWQADLAQERASHVQRENSGPLASIMLHLDAAELGSERPKKKN